MTLLNEEFEMSNECRYEEKTQTMWIFKDFHGGDDLVPRDEIKTWSAAVQSGKTDSGEPLKKVNFIFPDAASAEYNSAALAFAKFGTYVGDLNSSTAFGGDAPSFETKEDFGL